MHKINLLTPYKYIMKTKTLLFALAAMCFTACNNSEEEELTPKTPTNDGSVGVVECPDNNHPHAIDLGLPSGTKWSCCNLGAKTPQEFGGYYAWGELKTKKEYNWGTYIYYTYDNRGNITFNDLGDNISGTEYDAAHMEWGGHWHMPTVEQVEELKAYCNRTWELGEKDATGKYKGSGAFITSKKNRDAKLFFPAAGYYSEIGLNESTGQACFWTSNSFHREGELISADEAMRFNITNQDFEVGDKVHTRRGWGLNIRPVAN